MIIFPILASAMMLAHNGVDHSKELPVRQNVASRAAEIRMDIKQIVDERKQQIVQNLEERLANQNKNWVAHWDNVLQRLTSILAKIENRAQNLASDGKDTTKLMGAISDAKAAIAQAQAIIDEQETQDYTFTFTSEDDLRADIQAHIAHFKADIRLAFTAIQDAREAVRLALIELGQLTGERITIEKEVRTR